MRAEIKKQIEQYSHKNKHDEIVTYLKEELIKDNTTPQEIFDYAKAFRFTKKPNNPYVINAETINKLGVAVSNLKDKEKAKLCSQFYQLAAERNSSWGNRNYAQCLLEGWHGTPKSPKKSLKYAEKAVELDQANQNKKHQHKFILCKALRENRKWKKANIVLIEYFQFQFKIASSKKDVEKKPAEKEIQKIFTLCETIMNEFEADFEEENKDDLTESRCRNNLDELEPLLNCTISSDEFSSIKQHAYFIKAKCHEKLDELSQAWKASCQITNKNLSFYNQAVELRAGLLKTHINTQLVANNTNPESTTEEKKSKNNTNNFMLPRGITLPSNFGASWKAETTWFHSVDESAMEIEFNKRLAQIEKLIAAKKEEISLIEENIEDADNPNTLTPQKETLESELEKLQDVKTALKQKYKKYSPSNRETVRRHTTERHFFDPHRSKKAEELVDLTEKIIEHRFKTGSPNTDPIPLSGKSARLFITAERTFQEAVIDLNNPDPPDLGIPTAREKSWTVGNDWNQHSGTTGFGPIELYQIGGTSIQSEHRTSPKRQRLGDSFLPQHGTYSNDIYPFFSRLSKDEPEKEIQLTKLILRYGRNHQAVTLEELQTIAQEADENDVNCFNRICFLILEKEQGQWHSATQESFQIGMSVSQARCLIMLEAGFINFKEAFKNNVLFGVYSHTQIINDPGKVAKSCKHIDDLYAIYLQNKNLKDYANFFKKKITQNSTPTCLATREQAHQDMKYVYGGESDTDEEGYDTELSF